MGGHTRYIYSIGGIGMRKEDVAKPVDRKQCPKCEYFNNDKKRCSLKMCKDQPSLLDYIGNRF